MLLRACRNLPSPKNLLRAFVRRFQKAKQELLLSPGKILAEGSKCLRLTAGHWAKHVFIAGGSGMGKSKMLEAICRQLIDQGEGFTFIDPHGDTARALIRYAAAAGVDPLRVVYLKPGIDRCFSLDPLAGLPDDCSLLELEQAIDSTADAIIDGMLREDAAADQAIQKRLKHRLKNLVWFCAVRVNGKHLGLADMQALIDPRAGEFAALLDRVGPALKAVKPAIYYEFEQLRGTKNDALRDKWMESTTNLLSGVLGVMTQLVFGQHAQSLDPKELIRRKKIVLVDLGRDPSTPKTKGISRAQGNVIGGLVIGSLINAARETPEERRTDHYLIIDEAENYIGEDLRMAFAEMRKFRLPVCIAFQDLSCLRKGDLDLVERVISICRVWFVFQQQDPENIEYLGKALKYGSLDLTPLIHDTVLPAGYQWVDTRSLSISLGSSSSESQTDSVSLTRSQTRQKHTAESIQAGVNVSLSDTETESENETNSKGGAEGESGGETHTNTNQEAVSHTDSQNEQKSLGQAASRQAGEGVVFGPNGPIYNRNAGLGRVESESAARGNGRSDSLSLTSGTSDGTSNGWNWQKTWGKAKGWGMAWARSLGLGLSLGKGQTKGESRGLSLGMALGLARSKVKGESTTVGLTIQKTPLAQHTIKQTPTGGLVTTAENQFYAVMNRLASLPERMVLTKVKGMPAPFLLQVHDVKDPYEALGKTATKAERERDLKEFLRKVHEAPFYFTPTDEAHRGRIARFLAETAALPPASPGPERPEENPYGH